MNFIPCEASPLDGSSTRLRSGSDEITVPRQGQGPYVLGVRPEDLQLAPQGKGLQARVGLVDHLGDLNIAYATLAGTAHAVAAKQLPGAQAPRAGSDVGLAPTPNKSHVFAPEGMAGSA